MRRGFILNNYCAKRQVIWGAQRRSLGPMMRQFFFFFLDGLKSAEGKCLMTASVPFFNTHMEGISAERKNELTKGQSDEN